ncbi:MAG: hypothetical protein IT383_12380 [Deltaproteobacteria bacterium]|nr:hypothetical protein [Deltaproteobacteria bacterium]
MRTLSPPLVLAAMLCAMGAIVVAACPQRECELDRNCPVGEVCGVGGVCVPETPPDTPLIDAGPIGPGDDGGPGADGGPNGNLRVPVVEQLNAPVTAIFQDPQDATTALVATWSSGGSLDEVGELDLGTHRMASSPRFDFNNISGGCDVDEMHWFADQAPLQLPRGDELWFSCSVGGGAVLHYDDLQFAQSYRDAALDQIDLVTFVDSGDDTNGDARVVFAERGSDELKVVRFEPTDQESAARGMEEVTGDVAFDAIAGLWTVATNDTRLGDVVLVFDRGGAGALPRLVPVQRNHGELTWHGPPIANSDIEAITLPEGTHGALFRVNPGIPDPHQLVTSAADEDIPNVLITLPTEGSGGRALFFRYERESGSDLSAASPVSGFPEVDLAGTAVPSTMPSASAKLFLQETAFGAPWFAYVLPNAAIGFSIPLPSEQGDDVTNDVKRGAFQNDNDLPSAFLPLSAGRILIGFSNRNEIHQVGFSADF